MMIVILWRWSPDMGGWEPGMGDDSLHSIPVWWLWSYDNLMIIILWWYLGLRGMIVCLSMVTGELGARHWRWQPSNNSGVAPLYAASFPRRLFPAGLFFANFHFLNFCFQVHLFPKHVLDLHMNQEVGFAKEYEEIRFIIVNNQRKISKILFVLRFKIRLVTRCCRNNNVLLFL